MTRRPRCVVRFLRGALAAALTLPALAGAARAADGLCGPRLEDLVPGPEALGIRPYGWVAVAGTTSPGHDASTRTGRVFDDHASGVRLHQAYLALERALDDDGSPGIGGKLAVVGGTDARFLHAAGWLDDQDGDVQGDVLEAHLTAQAAVAGGLRLKVGRFVTPLGYEVIEAPLTPLPSRSFLFGYAIPFTHVGALLSLQADRFVRVAYGLVRGWDVGEDGNDAWTHLGSFAWTSPVGGDQVFVNAVVGPEAPDDDRRLRAVLDATWAFDLSERWKTALNGDLGLEEDAGRGGRDARWGGAAAYLTYTASERLAATLRAEVFHDRDGTRLGAPATVGELTLGADWRPVAALPGLRVRPEVRWDHAFRGRPFDGGEAEDAFSLTLEVLFEF